MERVAEQALHHSLPIQPYDANIVEEDGNVFEVADYIADLDRDIDRKLAKMRVACRP
ncbi:hypothetical protein [Endothiovibrio diazotrophicus]